MTINIDDFDFTSAFEWKREGKTVYALNEKGINQFSARLQPDNREASERELTANAILMEHAPELLHSLMEIVNYDGGADNALEDQYVMARAHEVIENALGVGSELESMDGEG